MHDTETFLRFSAQEWIQWPAGPYLIVSRADGKWLGSTGFAFQTPQEAMTWGKVDPNQLPDTVTFSSQAAPRKRLSTPGSVAS